MDTPTEKGYRQRDLRPVLRILSYVSIESPSFVRTGRWLIINAGLHQSERLQYLAPARYLEDGTFARHEYCGGRGPQGSMTTTTFVSLTSV